MSVSPPLSRGVTDLPSLDSHTSYTINNKGYTVERINHFIDHFHQRCTVLPTPSKESFSKYDLTDRSDRPIVTSAVKAGCVLITHDHVLLREAGVYVEAMTAKGFLDRMMRQD